MTESDHMATRYRPCVGIMLINRAGLVFIGRRRSRKWAPAEPRPEHDWQMPQGGIDPGETPHEAALRELWEETGVTSVSTLAEAPDWLTYDLPVDVGKRPWKGRYQGQRQRWFAMRFEGRDDEIDIDTPGDTHKPEFNAWRWERMERLPALIIPFKRAVYDQVVRCFADYAAR